MCKGMMTSDKGICREIGNVNRSTCNNAIYMRGNFSLYCIVDLYVCVLLSNSNLDNSKSIKKQSYAWWYQRKKLSHPFRMLPTNTVVE